ncbi:transmembrane protein 45B-like [Antedon mediterranea]|uniref:transmembrane protein 45B-like n=1 Tax=Antedon mediterranea TaxID=105859 RepID=UPI003AF8B0B2
MGTFLGHAAPGSFFFCFSVFWIIQLSYHDNGPSQHNKSALMRRIGRLPIEGIVIVIFGIVGVIGEMSYPSNKLVLIGSDGEFHSSVEWQHSTMYTYFALYGLIMALGRSFLPSLKNYEKIFGALAFFIEGLLFYYHVHHREELDVHIHILLVLSIFGCFASVLGEVFSNENRTFVLMRILFTMLQGTWFWMVGIVLYNPPSGEPWDQDDHKNVMFVTVAFTWHLLIDMFLLLVIYGIFALVFRSFSSNKTKYASMRNSNHNDVSMQLITKDNDDADECFDSE